MRGWHIRKATGGPPFDSAPASIVGPDTTEPVFVVSVDDALSPEGVDRASVALMEAGNALGFEFDADELDELARAALGTLSRRTTA